MKESKELYQEFMKATSKSKKGHLSIYSDYETVTDTADLISIRRDIEKRKLHLIRKAVTSRLIKRMRPCLR